MKDFLICFRKYYLFRARSTRQEFWLFCLFGAVILAIGWILDHFLATEVFWDGLPVGGYISWFFALVMLCPFSAVMTRRLHDRGKKEIWMYVYYLVLLFAVPVAYESINIYAADGGRFILGLFLLSVFVFVFYNIWLILEMASDSVGDNKYGKCPKNTVNDNTPEIAETAENKDNTDNEVISEYIDNIDNTENTESTENIENTENASAENGKE